jgi:hypothetical protein
MYIEKKYKFEAAYVNKDGIQGSSFEMFVRFSKPITSDEEEQTDQFIDQFDHSIMFQIDHSHKNFLSLSERTIKVESDSVCEITPFDYIFSLYIGLEKKLQEKISLIKVSDTKDTVYCCNKNDLSDLKTTKYIIR